MSREQWGHGYWKGYEDGVLGKVQSRLPLEAKYWICQMCISNADKDYDRSLFPVKEFSWLISFCGLTQHYAKRVYNYILNSDNRADTYGCYISGASNADWLDDYFVLPFDSKAEWQRKADKLLDEIGEKTA